jgi:hypothetical protein
MRVNSLPICYSLLFLACLERATSLSAPPPNRRQHPSRSDVLRVTAALLIPSIASAQQNEELTVYQLPSGLRYIELQPGTGPTPQYGQLLSIRYKAYVKLPANKDDRNPKPQLYDTSSYLVKHGNGKSIPGLEEGLHTLRVGGTRRLLIPPKLGYVESGLGPLPVVPWNRWHLNSLLDQMVERQGGTVVMEVTLLNAMDDEADQGYYQDDSLSPEDFETLKNNLQRKAQQAQGIGQV